MMDDKTVNIVIFYLWLGLNELVASMATAAAALRGEGRAGPPSSGPRQHGATQRRGLRGSGQGRLGAHNCGRVPPASVLLPCSAARGAREGAARGHGMAARVARGCIRARVSRPLLAVAGELEEDS
jgi:hypothetical protein